MPQVPAFCGSCDLIFPSGIELVNSRNIAITGGQASCPRCHSNGRILDGVYDCLGDTIQALLKMSLSDLETLLASLKRLRKEQAQADEIANNLSRYGFAASFMYVVRKEPPKAIAIITLLCAIIQVLISSYNAVHQKGVSKEEVEAMIYKHIEAQPRNESILTPPQPRKSCRAA